MGSPKKDVPEKKKSTTAGAAPPPGAANPAVLKRKETIEKYANETKFPAFDKIKPYVLQYSLQIATALIFCELTLLPLIFQLGQMGFEGWNKLQPHLQGENMQDIVPACVGLVGPLPRQGQYSVGKTGYVDKLCRGEYFTKLPRGPSLDCTFPGPLPLRRHLPADDCGCGGLPTGRMEQHQEEPSRVIRGGRESYGGAQKGRGQGRGWRWGARRPAEDAAGENGA